MFKNNHNLSYLSYQNYTNSDFEGFCVDLLEELSRRLKFHYKIKPITTLRYDDMVDEVRLKVLKIYFCSICLRYLFIFVYILESRFSSCTID